MSLLALKRHQLGYVILLILGIGLGYGAWNKFKHEPRTTQPSPSAVDIGFAQLMSVHHQQAISMAQMMLSNDTDSPLQRMAATVAYSQLRELGRMEGWLQAWGENLAAESNSMAWMLLGKEPPSDELLRYLIDCETSPTGMPGLATLAELETLRKLKGIPKDRRFLELMLAHHQGGLPMAQFAAKNAEVSAVRGLASLMAMEQAEEIMHMQRALAVIASRSQ